ncbi:MAG: alpha-glucosidase [Alicyclobacillus macrosporangiidus]|uniref:alpha-glucosidase n=1 Tax=Alicyclobacillus macrosporangiidus TaxID=392015 RepID=UPI0026F29581|nr:alpha-glucosidase [Alicyclobacillus macrosporangiidus]MCL6598576.1 alpha-glucosidase [Alicyclobacillus macrosporangiidus]
MRWMAWRRVWIGTGVVFMAVLMGWGIQRERGRPLTGTISVDRSLQGVRTFTLGRFDVDWDGDSGQFTVRDPSGHLVWATPAGQAFLLGATGTMTSRDTIGYFTLHRQLQTVYRNQTVDAIRPDGARLVFQGRLISSDGRSVPYTFTLTAEADDRLAYDAAVQEGAVNRLYFNWETEPSDHFYGFGVQYSQLDMRGKRVPILVEEHGNGRGMQPLTLLANLTHGAGGHWYNTYAPVPHFLSSRMQSLYSENTEYQEFNFTDPHVGQLEVDTDHLRGDLFAGTTPAALVQAYTRLTGRMQPLPDWTQQGFIFGAEGGTAEVTDHLNTLLAAGVPVTGLWIQDWVGQRTTSFGQQLVWNWVLNPRQYPNWTQFQAFLKQHGIRLLGYVNPFLTDVPADAGVRNLYREALEKGYFVKGPDGRPIVFQYPNFTASLLDLTNPAARAWLDQVMKEQLVGNGFTGWMADFGEELPLDAVLADGRSGAEVHNQYPVLWAQVNRDVMEQSGLDGEGLFFMRSGFSTSPAVTSDFWLGDQLESWDPDNGLPSAITALLSSGLSGYSLESSDIGGYTSITQFPLHYVRDPELLMRWMEFDAFTTLFRSHEGNQPAKNVQVYSDPKIVAQLRRFAILFRDLAPYREQLMREAQATGAPVDRPMFYQFPDDPKAFDITYQEFMLGPDVLIAPVTAPGQTQVHVHLPKGRWVHVWTGRVYDMPAGGDIEIEAPIGQPAVFYTAGSNVAACFQKALGDIEAAERAK